MENKEFTETDIHNARNSGYENGLKHQSPSPDTLRLIGELSDKREADHELLIRLDEGIKSIRTDIKELKDGTNKRIECLEKYKADKDIVESLQKIVNEKHDVQIRKLENKTANYLITFSLYTLFLLGLTSLLIWHIFKN